jgi:hypothetical protein
MEIEAMQEFIGACDGMSRHLLSAYITEIVAANHGLDIFSDSIKTGLMEKLPTMTRYQAGLAVVWHFNGAPGGAFATLLLTQPTPRPSCLPIHLPDDAVLPVPCSSPAPTWTNDGSTCASCASATTAPLLHRRLRVCATCIGVFMCAVCCIGFLCAFCCIDMCATCIGVFMCAVCCIGFNNNCNDNDTTTTRTTTASLHVPGRPAPTRDDNNGRAPLPAPRTPGFFW